VEVQIQLEKVIKDSGSDPANSFLGYTGEDCVANLLEDSSTYSSSTV
jgi:hypothetical protein